MGEMTVDYYNDAKGRNELIVTHGRGILALIPRKVPKTIQKQATNFVVGCAT